MYQKEERKKKVIHGTRFHYPATLFYSKIYIIQYTCIYKILIERTILPLDWRIQLTL